MCLLEFSSAEVWTRRPLLSYAVEAAGSTLSTFTIGFDEKHFAPMSGWVPDLPREDSGHSTMRLRFQPRTLRTAFPKYVWHMEEPVCEPPAIALYYLTKLAREHVTVLLSGEGGDEAFAGYKLFEISVDWKS